MADVTQMSQISRRAQCALLALHFVLAGFWISPAFAVIDPIESTHGRQLYTCDYMLRGIGTLISEPPVDAMGFDFRMEFIKLIPLIEGKQSLLDITDAVIQTRLEIAQKYKTQFADEMKDAGKSRLTGSTDEPCCKSGVLSDGRTQKVHTHLARFLGPPTEQRAGIDFTPFKNIPGFQQPFSGASSRVWVLQGRKLSFEIYSPSPSEYYFQHLQAKDLPVFIPEVERLWKQSQNWNLTTLQRVEALARFEWLWYWMNPYGRSAALTGDVASLIVQNRMVRAGDRILMREEYESQDLEAFIHDEEDYVKNRIDQLMPARFNGVLQLPEMVFRKSDHQRTWQWLKEIDAGGARIIDFLSTDHRMKQLYDHDAGVKENLTIRKHTLMVFDQYYEQLPFHDLSALSVRYGIDFEAFMLFVLALHEPAKAFAVVEGDRSLQHRFAPFLLTESMQRLGFSEMEIKLATELIMNDSFGGLLHDRTEVPAGGVHDQIRSLLAYQSLRLAADRVSMDVEDYAVLQELFYISDTSAYLFLRERIFYPRDFQVSSRLVLRSPRMQLLKERIEQRDR
jgi:hypothetical protein